MQDMKVRETRLYGTPSVAYVCPLPSRTAWVGKEERQISPPTAWVEIKRWANQQSNSSTKAKRECYVRTNLSDDIISTQPNEWSTRRFRKEEVTCTHTGINYTRVLHCTLRQRRLHTRAILARCKSQCWCPRSWCIRYRWLWHWRRQRRPSCQRLQSASVTRSCQCTSVAGYVPSLIEQREARLAFLPCGHQRFSASCVAQLEQQVRGCPICRSEITIVLHLY